MTDARQAEKQVILEGAEHPVRKSAGKKSVSEDEARQMIAEVRASGKGDARLVEEDGKKRLRFRQLIRD